ncbi:hypothetical protein GCM10009775_04800 [Microbacterium aoyamense]|uniref:Uncharacterized protein n=1 Tax=Microbacterium aoyamense TaxID=344166 RepID=A0ABN2P992_9MICO|nr:hypothetical protein [Microbacterium aoyamense]
MSEVVEVLVEAPVVEVIATPTVIVEVATGQRGPSGGSPEAIAAAVADYLEQNPPAAGATHAQMVPSASWVIPHTFGRIPAVTLYVDGEQVEADVTATTTTVTVSFPTPTTGLAVLN